MPAPSLEEKGKKVRELLAQARERLQKLRFARLKIIERYGKKVDEAKLEEVKKRLSSL